MAIQIQGVDGSVAEVGSSLGALRVERRPLDPGALGSYGVAFKSAIMAAGLASDAEIVQIRYGGTAIAVVHRLTFGAHIGGTAFTAGGANFRAVVSRANTANGSGGTAATLTGNNGKKRTSYPTTGMSDIRASSTAALTASASQTLDAQGFAVLGGQVGTTAGLAIVQPGSYFIGPDDHPVALAPNEGIVIVATVPATGTWGFAGDVHWTEVATY